MKALLKKDAYFLLDMKTHILISIIGAAISLVLIKKNPDFSTSFVISYFIILGSMMPAYTFRYEEENNSLSYLLTMAISRETYINSKYMLALLTSLGIGVFIAIFSALARIISGQAPFPFGSTNEITTLEFLKILILIEVFTSSLTLIYNSLTLPAFLKYGTKKGGIVSAFGIFIIIFISFVMIDYVGSEYFLEKLSKNNISNLAIIVLIVSALSMIISYGLSQKIMRAKEF